MVAGTPLKSSVARDRVLKWIQSGQFALGHRLPAEPELARMLNIHHTTVRRGLAELERQGVIEKRARVGNFVKSRKPLVVGSRIAVILQRWTSDKSPHRAAAGLAMAELDRTIDRVSYSLTMWTNGPDPEDLDTLGKLAINNGIEGILLYPQNSPEYLPVVRNILDAGIKVVLINHASTWDELGLFSIKYDEPGAIRQIFEKLIELGHRRIAVALDSKWHPAFHDMYRGCVESLFKKYHLGPINDWVVYPKWNHAAAEYDFACLEPLLDRRNPSTAVVVSDETLAAGAMRLCYRRQIRIPDDISLVSTQDYSPQSHSIQISAPPSDVLWRRGVRTAAEHLLGLLAGECPAEREITLRCDVNWTDSVGPPRGEVASTQ